MNPAGLEETAEAATLVATVLVETTTPPVKPVRTEPEAETTPGTEPVAVATVVLVETITTGAEIEAAAEEAEAMAAEPEAAAADPVAITDPRMAVEPPLLEATLPITEAEAGDPPPIADATAELETLKDVAALIGAEEEPAADVDVDDAADEITEEMTLAADEAPEGATTTAEVDEEMTLVAAAAELEEDIEARAMAGQVKL